MNRNFKDIKAQLLNRITNFGQPYITIQDANYNNRGELYLKHRHEGTDLRLDYARDTLRNMHTIWSRPIHLETVVEERRKILMFDGKEYSERRMD